MTKICKICKQEKPLSDFSLGMKYKEKQYLASYCKPCSTQKSIVWAKKNPERNRAKALRHLHKKLDTLIGLVAEPTKCAKCGDDTEEEGINAGDMWFCKKCVSRFEPIKIHCDICGLDCVSKEIQKVKKKFRGWVYDNGKHYHDRICYEKRNVKRL